MQLACLYFFIGILSVAFCAVLPCLTLIILILSTLLLAIFILRGLWKKICLGLFCFMLGIFWFSLHAASIINHILPKQLISRSLVVQARISTIPQVKQNFVSFNAELESSTLKHKTNARLTWLNPERIPRQGEVWQLTVRLKPPHSSINPGGFDFEQWLLAHHIHAVGYVVDKANNHLLQTSSFLNVNYWRQLIAQALHTHLAQEDALGIVQALSIGMQQNINDEQWQTMRRTGTNHIVAVAGLHLGFVALFIFKLSRFLWQLLPRLTLWIPATQGSALLALMGCSFYALMAGLGLPTKRALVMMSVFLFTLIWRRYLHKWQAYFLALWAILIFDPLCVLEQSFWLSFGAVAMILLAMHTEIRRKSHWQQWLYLQWVIMLGLLPLSLLFFQQFAPLSWLANLIAVLVVGFFVLPLVLLGTILLFLPSIAHFILLVAAKSIDILWQVLAWFAQQQWSIWQPAQPPFYYLIFSGIALCLLLMPKGFPARWLSLFWFLPLLTYQPIKPKLGEAIITVLDVGQGLAVLIETHKHTLLYDTGPKFGESDAAERVILPYLISRGIHHLDTIMISHSDMDHAGGLNTLVNSLPVKTVLESSKNCWAGQKWPWDGVQFEILFPVPEMSNLENNSSCVLRITAGNKYLLLPGDIESLAEKWLIANVARQLLADVLLAPHHGSKTSSTELFLNAVQAKFVVVSAGFYNRFHQPHQKVMDRYLARNLPIYETSKGGATTIYLSPKQEIRITQERQLNPRFWYLP